MGSRLGAFEILDLLGAGGMGEVYRARDTRLDRLVAIKVISSELADRPARPGAVRARGAHYLQVDAPAHLHALRRRLGTVTASTAVPGDGAARRRDARRSAERAGPCRSSRRCNMRIEIADALGAAHELRHRPSRPEARQRHAHQVGRQAARLRAGAAARVEGPGAPVAAARVERRSVDERRDDPRHAALHGTGAAPRREADARADLFAFGAVLYEMITGTRRSPPNSQSRAHCRDPRTSSRPRSRRSHRSCRRLDRIVSACLAKDPDERWQTARDLLPRADLGARWRCGDSSSLRRPAVHRSVPSHWRVAAAPSRSRHSQAYAMYSSRRPAPAAAPGHHVSPSTRQPGTKFPRGTAEMAVSPDGSRLVFVALSADGARRLWIRRFDSVDAQAVDGTEGAQLSVLVPRWPFDRFLRSGQKSSGSPKAVARRRSCVRRTFAGRVAAGTATAPFSLPVAFGPDSNAWRIPAVRHVGDNTRCITQGARSCVARLPAGWAALSLPRAERRSRADRSLSGIARLDANPAPVCRDSNVGPVGTHLFSLSNGSLIAQVVRARSRAGRRRADRRSRSAFAYRQPAALGRRVFGGRQRVLAYRSASPDSHLVWFDRTGKEVGSFRAPGDYHHPWLSPDEKRVAVEKTDAATGRHTIWILELSRGITSRLVSDTTGAHGPVWSPDGSRVVFAFEPPRRRRPVLDTRRWHRPR